MGAKRNKEYMGDGVYAEANEHGGVMLTTEDGVSVTNSIYLEQEVIAGILRFLGRFYDRDALRAQVNGGDV